MTIGEKIKELRQKHDLTQEKLANYLCVSYQAVSKWECGVSSPDLSLIGPLTRLLHVSADELLGLTETDEQRAELEKIYQEQYKNKNWESIYHMAADAVRDYPDDFRCLEWLADSEYHLADQPDSSAEYFSEMMDISMRHYETITENCTDTELCRKAHLGILHWLKITGRTIEAEWYEDMVYPGKALHTT